MVVRVADPNRPTFKQVSKVQEEINRRQAIRFRLVVLRTAVTVVGPEEEPNESSPKGRQLLSPPPVPETPALAPTDATSGDDAQSEDERGLTQATSPLTRETEAHTKSTKQELKENQTTRP